MKPQKPVCACGETKGLHREETVADWWCDGVDCDGSCGRVFTESNRLAAVAWWGGQDFPIAVGRFHKKKEVGQ